MRYMGGLKHLSHEKNHQLLVGLGLSVYHGLFMVYQLIISDYL